MPGGAFTITARVGPQVAKSRHGSLDDALAALEAQLGGARRAPERRVLGRTYEAIGQVAGRFEVKGPGGVRGGIDVRGDGSAEAYRGRVRKVLVEQRPGETAVEALRRELGG